VGVTNVGADVVDWYQVKFKDAKKEEYWHDNQWKKIQKRIETYTKRWKNCSRYRSLYTPYL
jgi:penicillin amidase